MQTMLDENREAERAVIASVLIDPIAIDQVHWLEHRDFTTAANSIIWSTLKSMYKQDKAIDVVTITEDLIRRNVLDSMGGVVYLNELMTVVPTATNASYYAEIVREHALKQRAYEAGQKISAISQKNYDDIEVMFSEMDQVIGGVRPGAQGDLVHLKDSEDEYFQYLDTIDDCINTGFKHFDNWSGGLGRGWLYVLAGRPSAGKTAKMLQLLQGIAAQNQGECLVWSQEMSRNKLMNRMLSATMMVPFSKFHRKQLTDQEKNVAREVYQKEFASLPIHIADSKNMTIEEIASTARQAKRQHGKVAAIFVDYLGIMNIPQPPGMSRQQAIGSVTKAAKRLAMELDCVFIMLCQMNREGTKVIEPQLEHLRESGDIEQDADVVEFLWKNPEDVEAADKSTVIQSFIAKGRDIGIRRFRLGFYGGYQKFHELGDRT